MGTRAQLRPQKGKQSSFLSCPANEICYGGARGGGKTYGALLHWLTHSTRYGDNASGILFRRTYPELENVEEKASSIFPSFGGIYGQQKRTWKFPNGSTLKLRYLDKDKDADNYQGHEYNWMCFEEAGNWPRPDPLDKLRACLRSAEGVKHKLLLTCNPGGVGHNWVKTRYIDPCPPMRIQRHTDESGGDWAKVYIPAKVTDNPLLLKSDPAYISRLKESGPEWLVKAWLDGDWDIVAGGMFDDVWRRDIHVVKPFEIPASWYVDRGFDWGSSKPFAVCWFAESDGTPAEVNGKKLHFPRGSIVLFREYYGCEKGKANVGVKMLAKDIAKETKLIDDSIPNRVHPGNADSAIYNAENGSSIADDMKPITWTKADKSPGSRVHGWQALRRMLVASHGKEEAGFYITENCVDSIRTLPTLPRDDKKIDDIDTDSEDHLADVIRYRVNKKKQVTVTTNRPFG